jgi:hypothetical protein
VPRLRNGPTWRITERLCPNEAIVRRTGLKGLPALKASGLFDKFDKVRAEGEPSPPLPDVDADVDALSGRVDAAEGDEAPTPSPKASTPDDHVDADVEARRKKAERQTRWRHNKTARALGNGAPPS